MMSFLRILWYNIEKMWEVDQMGMIKVWTKQHKHVLESLKANGRYTARREYVVMELKEHAPLVLETYEWLVKNGPDAANRPADVEFPI